MAQTGTICVHVTADVSEAVKSFKGLIRLLRETNKELKIYEALTGSVCYCGSR